MAINHDSKITITNDLKGVVTVNGEIGAKGNEIRLHPGEKLVIDTSLRITAKAPQNFVKKKTIIEKDK